MECKECHKPLLRLNWNKGTDLVVCDNSGCILFRTPQGTIAAINELKVKVNIMEEKLKSLEELKSRVREGNQKLNDAWETLVKMNHSSQKWEEEMERWHQANEKLSNLCTELKFLGFSDCLYLVDGKKTRGCLTQGSLGCRVCPSQHPYWEQELMDLPSGRNKGS